MDFEIFCFESRFSMFFL